MCRLNPKVDFAFEKLFGSEENKDILMSFIKAVDEKGIGYDVEKQNIEQLK
ncbi:MAG: Rpn family recombination-promoting nuclease/putative transposase [Marinisporobacter sp.]|jgi:hypothetical protein|nr:Rpn family recombination-promoting nuclease/putative transposase [Marinisporobacter sp.]